MEELFEEYKYLLEIMEESPGTYHLEEKRGELHKQLEEYFPGMEQALERVLHNLTPRVTSKNLEREVRQEQKRGEQNDWPATRSGCSRRVGG